MLDRWDATRVMGIVLMVRTKRGQRVLEAVSRPRLFWRMFGELGLWTCRAISLLVVLLFGRGKISSLMGEVGKGITSFKKGISEGEDDVKNGDKDTAELSDDTVVVTDTKTDKDRV